MALVTGIAEGPRLRAEPARAKLANVDWSLVAFTVLIVPVGLLAIFSATRLNDGTSYLLRQGFFFAIGSVAMAIVASFDYRLLRDFLGLIYVLAATALVSVLLIGREVAGTKGWFVVGPFRIQPAEFAKLALIIALAALFTGRTGGTAMSTDSADSAGDTESTSVVKSLAVLGGVSLLVYLENETGSILVYVAIALGIFLVAGLPMRVLLLLVASGAILVSLLLSSGVLSEYKQARLTSFVNGDDLQGVAYNQRQSETAVGSGGLTGSGVFEGPQTQGGFVPEQRTDFIFTVIAEETGLVGAAVVLALEALILTRIFRVAQLARDGFGALICVGVFSMILIQVFQNVGMTMRLMPITGIPLPFVSYGGSSLITNLVGLGLVQSVAIHRHRGSAA